MVPVYLKDVSWSPDSNTFGYQTMYGLSGKKTVKMKEIEDFGQMPERDCPKEKTNWVKLLIQEILVLDIIK